MPVLYVPGEPEQGVAAAIVFRGSQSLCREFSLVLEAKNIEHEAHEDEGAWELRVPASQLHQAYSEIGRYSAERSVPRDMPAAVTARPGASGGAIVYIAILLITAYCAGRGLLGADWLSLGDLDAGSRGEWWRAITALRPRV